MSSRRPPRAEPLRWLASLRDDSSVPTRKLNLAPLTGTDTKALIAIAYCWQLFAYTRSPSVLHAIQNLLSEMQESTAPLTRDLIAWAMDWSDRERYWPVVWGAR